MSASDSAPTDICAPTLVAHSTSPSSSAQSASALVSPIEMPLAAGETGHLTAGPSHGDAVACDSSASDAVSGAGEALASPLPSTETAKASDISGLPSTAPSRSIEPSKYHYFYGEKHWLLIKEGIHIMLDRILIKDAAHLLTKCPLYGRLARMEKRALVLKFATALVQRQPVVRNVLVDTIFLCAHEACEIEAKLEAPATAEKKGKSRVPFMQKVVGEAYNEYYKLIRGPDAKCPEVTSLLAQDASAAVVSDIMQKLKVYSLSSPVAGYFSGLTDGGIGRTPAVIYNKDIAALFGIDYFLPPVPTFTAEDERNLLDCIRRDEEDAGKETVFAANLKKAMKLIRQGRVRGVDPSDDDYSADATAFPPFGTSAAMRVDSLSPAIDVAAKWAKTAKEPEPAPAPAPSAPSPYIVPLENISSCASVARVVDLKKDTKAKAAKGSSKKNAPSYCDWWRDLRWINKFAKANLTSVLSEFFNPERGLLQAWSTNKDVPEADKMRLFSLNAEETCKVIDHQPLWLSLRGMVGSNLYADGMWPITSNDGHLSIVRFRRNDKERFWFIDKGGVEASVLAGIFLGWLRSMRSSLRSELVELGTALASGNNDDVSRCIQRHLEAGILSFMVLKVVAFAIESEAAKAADRLGQLLVEEEETRSAAKASKKKKKKLKAAEKDEDSVAAPATTMVPVPNVAAVEGAKHDRRAPVAEVLPVAAEPILTQIAREDDWLDDEGAGWEEVSRPKRGPVHGAYTARNAERDPTRTQAARKPYSARHAGSKPLGVTHPAPPLPVTSPVAVDASAPTAQQAFPAMQKAGPTNAAPVVSQPPQATQKKTPQAVTAPSTVVLPPAVAEVPTVAQARVTTPPVEQEQRGSTATVHAPHSPPSAPREMPQVENPALGLINALLGSSIDSSPPRAPASINDVRPHAGAPWAFASSESPIKPPKPAEAPALWSSEPLTDGSKIWSGGLGLLPVGGASSMTAVPSASLVPGAPADHFSGLKPQYGPNLSSAPGFLPSSQPPLPGFNDMLSSSLPGFASGFSDRRPDVIPPVQSPPENPMDAMMFGAAGSLGGVRLSQYPVMQPGAMAFQPAYPDSHHGLAAFSPAYGEAVGMRSLPPLPPGSAVPGFPGLLPVPNWHSDPSPLPAPPRASPPLSSPPLPAPAPGLEQLLEKANAWRFM